MNFKTYNRLNNLLGWIVFAIAAFTYLSTMEWTVSLWDCGEFIPSSYKLQTCHPPGAPFFLLVNRIFTMLAMNNTKMVPLLVNGSAAMCSAFTILFLFWSITAMAFKLVIKEGNDLLEKANVYAIMGSGIVGALAYTWSDTFWFSAVEGEVYAMSSFFTALIFWLGLKWERRSSEPYNLRWIVLIAYMVGIVIGVHLLGLLVIPVIVLMYYFRKNGEKVTLKGSLIAFGIGVVALGIVQFGIILKMLSIAAKFDLLFVDNFGLPLWSGVIFFFIVFLGTIVYFVIWSQKKGRVFLNLGLLSMLVVIIGYMSYALVVVRSYANTPIDMNDPEDPFSLVSYLAREQYGDSYVLQGPYYPAYNDPQYYDTSPGAMQYRKVRDKDGKESYAENGNKIERKFKGKMSTFFPRMYSPQENHIPGYRYWVGLKQMQDPTTGKTKWEDEDPSFKFSFVRHNLNFFWNYQIKYMYFRYFAWNFIGRQNDLQGTQGEFHQGNWMTGIAPIDKSLGLGPQTDLPDYMEKNKAKNLLFGLPFLLGILGAIYQYKKGKLDFVVVALFFFMTGLAIEIYLNMPNPQPRERDYAFVGSFYVFAIWIGLGVMWIYDQLKNRVNPSSSAIGATVITLVLVPGIMVAQEWNDHNRSHRYTSLDYGVDYLESCAPHAVLFCNGDNDTYPLWYAQEVEGIRSDIRIINLSLLSTDWYVDEMRKPINNSAAGLTFSLSPDDCVGWEYVAYDQNFSATIGNRFNPNIYTNANDVMKFLASKDSRPQLENTSDVVPFLPTRKIYIPVNKDFVIKNGTVEPQFQSLIEDSLRIDLNRNTYLKSDIMVMDFITTNAWRLPIYFSITSGPNEYLGLGKYLQQEGLTYRLVPFRNPGGAADGQDTRVNVDAMYKNVMSKFKFGGLDDGDKLVDYVTARQCNNMRGVFVRLAKNLNEKGEKDKSIMVLDKAMKMIPENNVPFDGYFVVQLMAEYYRAGAIDKGHALAMRLSNVLVKEMDYYDKCDVNKVRTDLQYEVQRGMYGLNMILRIAEEYKQNDIIQKVKAPFTRFETKFNGIFQNNG